jgi:glutamine amidotransferase
MSRPEVVIIDYGMGNLLSVQRGLEHCGASVVVSSEPNVILSARRVVLPGVGAFPDAMQELSRRKLLSTVLQVASSGMPLLGICLGMQLLLEVGEEFGETPGLGLIPGRVIPIPEKKGAGLPNKIPHIGWGALYPPDGKSDWRGTILQYVKPGEATYFVHSFMAHPTDQANNVANCLYGDTVVTAVVARANVVGCQFHPEKSGAVGLRVLQQFLLL